MAKHQTKHIKDSGLCLHCLCYLFKLFDRSEILCESFVMRSFLFVTCIPNKEQFVFLSALLVCQMTGLSRAKFLKRRKRLNPDEPNLTIKSKNKHTWAKIAFSFCSAYADLQIYCFKNDSEVTYLPTPWQTLESTPFVYPLHRHAHTYRLAFQKNPVD